MKQTHSVVLGRHFLQLDGVRGIAIGLVLMAHFVMFFAERMGLGALGVRLFFVLSGFLITGILIDTRTLVENGECTTRRALFTFYMRRGLRIFPLYYGSLILFWLLTPNPPQGRLLWNALYLNNIVFPFKGTVGVGGLDAHLWSLAVEEHFYLLWPTFVLFTPRRLLYPLIGVIIVISPAWRVVTMLLGYDQFVQGTCTPAALDSLASGAALAFLSSETYGKRGLLDGVRPYCLVVGGLCVLVQFGAGLGVLRVPATVSALLATGQGLIMFWLVDAARRGTGGPLGWVLERRLITYMGLISYGIYVMHNQINFAVIGLIPNYGSHSYDRPMRVVLAFVATLLVCSASYYIFERPINNLKRHFNYRPKAAKREVEQVTEREAVAAGT